MDAAIKTDHRRPSGIGAGEAYGQPVKGQAVLMHQRSGPKGRDDVKEQVGGFDFLDLPDQFLHVGGGVVRQQLDQHGKGIVLKMLYHIALPPGDDLHHIPDGPHGGGPPCVQLGQHPGPAHLQALRGIDRQGEQTLMAGEQVGAGVDGQLVLQRRDGALGLIQFSLLRCQQVSHLLHSPHPLGEHEPVIDRH